VATPALTSGNIQLALTSAFEDKIKFPSWQAGEEVEMAKWYLIYTKSREMRALYLVYFLFKFTIT
jgi:hypothetical protein